mmetsp:Transcript_21860/g.49852  ORF Transcript_21860/g.49852 Transcript_21860/m.49852 type:complete len:85 (-) Transcript_21860:378-632(-)
MTHLTLETSKWLVGSSMSKISAFCNIARARASFILQPPESDEIGSSQSPPAPAALPSVKPTLSKMSRTCFSEKPADLMAGHSKM